ncbi:MAG: pirin family protein [Tenuifilaceae bacterium]|jgi:redox-sensitive bicupin YhaK (pirin superfamily)|nr:pirin family protein [Tenuifilaceae bacterium]
MYNKIINNIKPLGFMWNTVDPFLFCVHHLDFYPKGNGEMGPDATLAGRYLGQDFTVKDGWRMYHGETVPGFPAHPHRGFETVTIVLKGFVDHSDSHGASGRYGSGDVQWMTAGAGLQHCEMFPLVNSDKENHLELFQIWLNLPQSRKFCDPHYAMLWAEDVPTVKLKDEQGHAVEIYLVAGKYGDIAAPPPAPDSWAADPANEVAIWPVRMEAGAKWVIPAASPEVKRMLYFYKGNSIRVAGIEVSPMNSIEMFAGHDVVVESGSSDSLLLLLQGMPIEEPVVQHGPFVMNTQQEIHQAIRDYQKTQFGGWPWSRYDHVHPRSAGRFAKYADGREEVK